MRPHRKVDLHDSGESFDVLLQLTLPIVLILAFIVVTEFGVWKKQYDALYGQTVGTPMRTCLDQQKLALLTLQEQLLVKAAREVFEKKAGELQINRYASIVVTPEQILSRQLPHDFAAVSATLYQFFGTQKRRSEREAEMREQALKHYQELVNMQALSGSGLTEDSLETLRHIVPANEAKLDTSVTGEMGILFRKAADPQLELISKWIYSEPATTAAGEEIRKAWQDLVNAAASDKQAKSDRFVNLKVLALQQSLNRLDAPLLEGVVHEIL